MGKLQTDQTWIRDISKNFLSYSVNKLKITEQKLSKSKVHTLHKHVYKSEYSVLFPDYKIVDI